MKIAIIGTYPPRKCGIATFTQDLYKSMSTNATEHVDVFAVDAEETLFPSEVVFVIKKNSLSSYLQAADILNRQYDACIIQHEYGIFGGDTGNFVIDLLQKLNIPVITNLHTVLEHPNPNEYLILRQLAQYSTKITIMTPRAVEMLDSIYAIDRQNIDLIPHGVPTFNYDQQSAKQKLGLADTKIMLSFGFLGKNKGFETAIEALTQITEENFVYIILGTTHPNILKEEGEAYRDYLQERARALGVADKVQFINLFASEELIVDYLTACDIYVTPYPNENQISSGTLSFAIGAGAAVISTPYWYAKDLLADERGLLFPFNDARALAQVVNNLLENPLQLQKYRANAAAYGRQISWSNIGRKHALLLRNILKSTAVPQVCSLIPTTARVSTLITTAHARRSS